MKIDNKAILQYKSISVSVFKDPLVKFGKRVCISYFTLDCKMSVLCSKLCLYLVRILNFKGLKGYL